MKQKRFAGMANRAFRIVAACAVLMMTAGLCSCGGSSSNMTAEEREAEKQAKSELKELESQLKKVLGITPEEALAMSAVMYKKKDEEIAKGLAKYEVMTAAEKVEGLKKFEIDTWSASDVEQLKPYIADAKKKMSAVSKEKDKLVKEYKEQQKKMAEIKSMSVDKLKNQKPAPESDFEVKPTDDSFTSIAITKYKGSDPLVVIPATMQGLPVKRIGENAFETGLYKGNKNIVAVVIPEGVTVISAYAFCDCENLSVAVLPSTLKAIDKWAFSKYSSRKSIELPAGLVCIGNAAFEESGLTSVSLPKSLRLLDYKAFCNCNSLAEIQIPADHAVSCMYTYDYDKEITFESFFSGTKIKESIALQKLLKETKTRKISQDEYKSIRA